MKNKGFTLIELLIVMAIIGILASIAIPTYLDMSSRAHDKSSQSDARNFLVAATIHQ